MYHVTIDGGIYCCFPAKDYEHYHNTPILFTGTLKECKDWKEWRQVPSRFV